MGPLEGLAPDYLLELSANLSCAHAANDLSGSDYDLFSEPRVEFSDAFLHLIINTALDTSDILSVDRFTTVAKCLGTQNRYLLPRIAMLLTAMLGQLVELAAENLQTYVDILKTFSVHTLAEVWLDKEIGQALSSPATAALVELVVAMQRIDVSFLHTPDAV
jgi:hypothetical protein